MAVIHFWLPLSPSSSEILAWNPEAEPRQYPSGVGHRVLELFNRLAWDGVDVTLGPEFHRGVALTVLYAPSIERPPSVQHEEPLPALPYPGAP